MDNITLAYSVLDKIEHDYLQLQADFEKYSRHVDELSAQVTAFAQKTKAVKRYTIHRAYDDCTSASEQTDDITTALNVCAIYLVDPTCVIAHIWDNQEEKFVFDFAR